MNFRTLQKYINTLPNNSKYKPIIVQLSLMDSRTGGTIVKQFTVSNVNCADGYIVLKAG